MVDRRLPMDWTHFWTRELAQGMTGCEQCRADAWEIDRLAPVMGDRTPLFCSCLSPSLEMRRS